MLRGLALAACAAVTAASAPSPLFFHDFVGGLGPFVASGASDYAGQSVAVEAVDGALGDFGLVLKDPAHRYAVTAPFSRAISNGEGDDLVIQYELRLQNGLDCGGGYIKLYEAAEGFDAAAVTPNTPYIVMFGPDRCGSTDKVHFIIRWRNPVTDTWEEKHLTNAPRPVNDKLSHLYTLVVRADGTFTIKVDNEDVRSGSLSAPEDFSPPVLPPAEIDDATDVKPADWVDAAQISDPDATKPEDWDEDAPSTIEDAAAVKPAGWLDDEPAFVADPSAHRPEEWDDEEDGIWEPPTVENPKCSSAPGCGEWRRPVVPNPAYKGPWRAPLIANPAYKGPWAPRKVANPAFFTDEHVGRLGGAAIGAVGVEVWTMSGGITYDGFLVTRDEKGAEAFGASTWKPKHAAQEATAAAERQAKEHESRLAAAETGGWAEKAAYWLGEATALAKSQPAATAATAVALLATLLALIFFGCSGSPAAAPRPPIFEPEDERVASAAARREMRAEASAAAATQAAPAPEPEPLVSEPAETIDAPAADAPAADDDAAPAPSSGKSTASRKAKAASAAAAASVTDDSPASSGGSPSTLRRSTRRREA